ncbi:MAG: SDR family oxidoreductase [Burkholderiales bacterium]|jgi:NAD(P)-dependent dehydrogenase (short-subunit alcohol dehydrogenase family)|nr:MAG: SDR family oxidoreductase [Burkholderiales bacterium]
MSSHTARYPSLAGRSVFVTGGGSGIGASIVSMFAEQDAKVAFIDIAEGPSRALADSIAAQGRPKPWWRTCDVKDVPALQAAIRDAAGVRGDFHVLVNNVANDDRHPLDSVTPEYYDERIAVNQRAALFALQAVVPGMKRLGFGSIVNIGSNSWRMKNGDMPCYTVAKSSMSGLTRGTATPLGKHRIRVNTVMPGWVMTERQKALWLTSEGEKEIERNQCLPDRVQPEDIAAMVLWLGSDDSHMCSAQEFTVDGGWT